MKNNDNPNNVQSLTQCEQILRYLKTGRILTSEIALVMFGCQSLRARISDLRIKGYNIHLKYIAKYKSFYYLDNKNKYVTNRGKGRGKYVNSIKKGSKLYQLYQYLLLSNSVTSLDIINKFNLSGSQALWNIKKVFNCEFESQWLKTENGKRVKVYKLKKEQDS